MSTKPINDGGDAFPSNDTENYNNSPGMTLRDYFAAKAMQGLASEAEHWSHSDLPKIAYEIADGMLAERSATEETK